VANGVCNTPVAVNNTLLNATTDNSLPNEYGYSLGSMQQYRPDGNGNGLPYHADRYPHFLNLVFDPDRVGDLNNDGDHFDTVNGVVENPGASRLDWYGAVEPLRPVARYSGSFIVASEPTLLQFVVFAPGALSAFAPPHNYSDLGDPALGYAMIPILNDPTAPPAVSDITDTCSPNTTRVQLYGKTRNNPCLAGSSCTTEAEINSPAVQAGDVGAGPCTSTDTSGCERYRNPSTAGTHFFYTYQVSQRDLDTDGYENSLDSCPYQLNVHNPRTGAGGDGDMLDSACDPGPGTTISDQDGDNWSNALDNCPLVPNGSQTESELITPRNIAAPRGGPRSDGLGDECDINENADCSFALDDDGDTKVNDGCPQVAFFSEASVSGACNDAIDAADENPSVAGNQDDDDVVNDGCPAVGNPERDAATCDGSTDNDAAIGVAATGPDGLVNDGCPVIPQGAGGGAESVCGGGDAIDHDNDGWVNDGCAVVGVSENGFCTDAIDNDADTVVSDGCPGGPAAAGPGLLVEGVLPPHADCADQDDDDGDGAHNDGCPQWGPGEYGCLNAVDDDGDTVVNEGCASSANVANGHYHTIFNLVAKCIGGIDADGDGWCNLVGSNQALDDPDDLNATRTPEHYARQRAMPIAHSGSGSTVGSEPIDSNIASGPIAAVCFDGIDNDGDGSTDLFEPDGPDNTAGGDGSASGNLWDCAPRSTDLSGTDTDGDGTTDRAEIFIGTDALGRCERGGAAVGNVASGDWPDDISGNTPPDSLDKINVVDVNLLNSYSGSGPTVTPPGKLPYVRRVDLAPGPASFSPAAAAWIGLPDIQTMSGRLPPMFSGAVKSFNRQAVCSAHPRYGD